MQVFGNVATQPERKHSKASGKGYFEFRLAESQRGVDTSPTWFTVRMMKDENPMLDKGDFVRCTGKLKTDFYLSKQGLPTGSLLIIAFEAAKIAKPAALMVTPAGEEQVTPKAKPKSAARAPVRAPEPTPERPAARAQETVREPVQEEYESDWSCLYD